LTNTLTRQYYECNKKLSCSEQHTCQSRSEQSQSSIKNTGKLKMNFYILTQAACEKAKDPSKLGPLKRDIHTYLDFSAFI
jgi:hypothetical protein